MTPSSNSTTLLRDSLLIGFCALFMLVAKMLLRLNLGIPGHSMFFTVFFMLLPRATTGRALAATATGMTAGLASVMLGIGKGGPLLLLKFMFPALAVDLAFLLFPVMGTSYFFCAVVGMLAAATRIVGVTVTDYLVGMDTAVILAHALLKTAGGALFGAAGGLAAVPVIRKLKARGMIPESR